MYTCLWDHYNICNDHPNDIQCALAPAVALRWDGLIAVNYAARAHGVKCACPVKPALL